MTDTARSDSSVFADYLVRTRWFGGKGRPFAVAGVRTVGVVPAHTDDGPPVVIHLVELAYDDEEGGAETYQVPLAFYEHPETRLDHAFVGWWEDARARLGARVRRPARPRGDGRLAAVLRRRHGRPGDRRERAALPPAAGTRPRPGGPLHAVRGRAVELLGRLRRGRAAEGVPQDHPRGQPRHLRPRGADPGRLRARRRALRLARGRRRLGGEVVQLAMLQQFLRTATDGWDLALASVRDLFAEPDAARLRSPAATSPARPPGSARRCARCTTRCASTSRPRPGAAQASAELAGGDARAAWTPRSRVVPELEAHAKSLRAIFDEVARPRTASRSSRSTATCTSGRRCAPRRAGRSSTSRASRPSRWPSGSCRTRRGATSPGCCAASTTRRRVVQRR